MTAQALLTTVILLVKALAPLIIELKKMKGGQVADALIREILSADHRLDSTAVEDALAYADKVGAGL